MSEPQKLIAFVSQQTALERRMAAKILKSVPGLGDKSMVMAQTLCESGLSAAAASMLIHAVYSPSDPLGRGQGTRARWFIEAVNSRYSGRLDNIRRDPTRFKNFVAEMEEVTEMRDELNGEGITVSFQVAFLLWEIGLDADSVLGIIQGLCSGIEHTRMATALLIKAAQQVKAGHFMELETAIEFMRYGYDPASR